MSKVTQKVRHLPMRLVIGIAVLLLTAWGARLEALELF